MKLRSKRTIAGLAVTVASVTALAACSSSGSGGGSSNSNGSSVKVPGSIGSVPEAASSGTKKAGTITWALQPGTAPNWIFPVIPSANNSVFNSFTLQL